MIWLAILVVSFVFVLVWTELFADTWALLRYAAKGDLGAAAHSGGRRQ
jgi:hypothetical protein